MSEHLEIKRLRRELEQAKVQREQAEARAEKAQAQREQAEARAEKAQAQREQAEARAEKAQARREQAEAQAEKVEKLNERTTLEEYLRDYHSHVFKALRLADKYLSPTDHATKVDNKYYPMWLHPWSDFPDLQRDHFDTIQRALGDKRLFPESVTIRYISELASRRPAAIEKDIRRFVNAAMELPVEEIFASLLATDKDICQEFNVKELRFSNHNRELKHPDYLGTADVADEEVQPPTYPEGFGFRRHPDESESLVFVFDYKAAHKFKVQDLELALKKEKLFMEVIQEIHNDKEPNDKALKERVLADRQIAMALTQVFDYMVGRGVRYGYVTAGKASVFLHIELHDVRTLNYHLCAPDKGADVAADDESGSFEVSQTAVAQLASFCLLALRSNALQGRALGDLCHRAELKPWPTPYIEAGEHLRAGDTVTPPSEPSSQETPDSPYKGTAKIGPATREFSLRSRATCKSTEAVRRRDDEDDEGDGPSRAPAGEPGTTDSKKRKEWPSSGSSDDGGSETAPTQQYCTQVCLLGLKRNRDLDESCPNVSSHRTAEGGSRHVLDANEFTALVGERLRQNAYRNCVAVDPYGQEGKIGAIGALFKLELAPYGYTFVGKGTQSAHLGHLQHEGLVYSRLERLQGKAVPVHLGIVDLVKGGGYILPGGARVVHLMLMSWGGETAVDAGELDLMAEQKRSLRAVWHEGVNHDDEREPNMLWNEERRRVMVIDFDQATLRPAPKHKRVLALSMSGNKRKRQDDTNKN